MANGTAAALLLTFVGVRAVVAPPAGSAVGLLLLALAVGLVAALLALRKGGTP